MNMIAQCEQEGNSNEVLLEDKGYNDTWNLGLDRVDMMIIQHEESFLSALNYQGDDCHQCQVETTLNLEQYNDDEKARDRNAFSVINS